MPWNGLLPSPAACVRLALITLVLQAVPAVGVAFHEPEGNECEFAGRWLDPKTYHFIESDHLMAWLAGRHVVLLGESHVDAEHHRWQLHVLAGLHALRPNMVVGFEMFPARSQAALDSWVASELSEAEFLEAAHWSEVWGFDADLYLPLFHFARQNRLPMVALNVERELVSRVAQEGWSAIPEDERQGVSDPAPPEEDYRRRLADLFSAKMAHSLMETLPESETEEAGKAEQVEADEAEEPGPVLGTPELEHFVEAQLVWDRAMAEAIVRARAANPEALIVGIVGRGHIAHRHGVPHQLAALGEREVAVLMAVERGDECNALEPDEADAVFLVQAVDDGGGPEGHPRRPRLGITIEQAERGIRILAVAEGSVAEAAQLKPGDLIVSAAATRVTRSMELIAIIQRQAPGTWLPLEVERGDETLEIVARFPPAAP